MEARWRRAHSGRGRLPSSGAQPFGQKGSVEHIPALDPEVGGGGEQVFVVGIDFAEAVFAGTGEVKGVGGAEENTGRELVKPRGRGLEKSRGDLNPCPEARRLVPDFLTAEHAQIHADRLLARDRGHCGDYFKDLVLMEP